MKKTTISKLIEKYDNLSDGGDAIDFVIWFGDNATELLEEERQNLIEFYVEVMKKGLDNENERGWSDVVEKKVRDTAETYLTENYQQ